MVKGVEGFLSVTSQLTRRSHVCVFDRNTIESFTSKCNKLSLSGKYVNKTSKVNN